MSYQIAVNGGEPVAAGLSYGDGPIAPGTTRSYTVVGLTGFGETIATEVGSIQATSLLARSGIETEILSLATTG